MSAKTFVVDLNANSLSIEEVEFEESMQAAKLANKVPQVEVSSSSDDFKALGDLRGPHLSGRIHDIGIHLSGELVLLKYFLSVLYNWLKLFVYNF